MLGNKQNKAKWYLVIAFLSAISSQLSANTQKLLRQGKLNPRDRTLVVRNEVSVGGTINLLDGYNSAIKGSNDFNGNELANNVNFILDMLTINYGTGVAANVKKKYDTVNYTTALPPALKTANLIIEQDDKVIRKLSIAAINEAKSTDARWFELEGFALLKDATITAIKIEFGQNADFGLAAGDAAYVEVLFKGFETATTY